jgi:hypothetical protein
MIRVDELAVNPQSKTNAKGLSREVQNIEIADSSNN